MRRIVALVLALAVAFPVAAPAFVVVDVPDVGKVWAFTESEIDRIAKYRAAMNAKLLELADRIDQLEVENAALKETILSYRRSRV